MEKILFSFSLCIIFINIISIISIFAGSKVTFPFYKMMDPTSWIFFYPSVFYQSWFWSNRLIFS